MNPNAPLFVPAAVRQVEDFSPEWWQLVTTSTWYHDYWLTQQEGEDGFFGNEVDDFSGDVADLLPDTIDDEDFSIMDEQFEQFMYSSEAEVGQKVPQFSFNGMPQNGLEVEAESLMRNLSLSKSMKERGHKSPVEIAKYREKPAKSVSPKGRFQGQRIQQPR